MFNVAAYLMFFHFFPLQYQSPIIIDIFVCIVLILLWIISQSNELVPVMSRVSSPEINNTLNHNQVQANLPSN